MSNNITPKLNYAIHPGEILEDILGEHALTQKDLAARIEVTPKHINEIIKGKASITSAIAQKLSFVFGTSPGFWINLQKNYEEIVSRLAIDQQFDKEQEMAENYTCYKELAEFGFVKKTHDKKEKYLELLHFFGISSLSLLDRNYAAQYQYRKPDNEPNTYSVAAWLRMGELCFKGAKQPREYNEKAFKNALLEARKLTRQPIDQAAKRLEELCFESGVIVIFAPYLRQSYISGVTKWFPAGTPLIQLSSRMKRSDAFWFTFFHESAHILKHSKRKSFVEWEGNHSDDPEEKEANEFAANTLVSRQDYKEFIGRGDFSSAAIQKFASEIGVGADIVAGRLAREEDVNFGWREAASFITKIDIQPGSGASLRSEVRG